MTTTRISLPVSVCGGAQHIVADLFVPAQVRTPATVLMCLPGGGMSRRYFDLDGDDGEGTFSMAKHCVDAGRVVALLDHLGVGESSIPDDPWTLTPTVVADANAAATDQIVDGLRAGNFGPPALPGIRPVAVGHSMGGLMAVMQQARHRQFLGLGLLGSSACGLREALNNEELAVLDSGERSEPVIRELARKRFGAAIVAPKVVDDPVGSRARKALAAARSNMLSVCGLTSMMTGSMRAEFEEVDVPVFLGLGENDIAGPSHGIPADFPNSNDIRLFVLAGAGHNTNVARNRTELWDRLLDWVSQLAQVRGPFEREAR